MFTHTIYFLIYEDDIVVTNSSLDLVTQFVDLLGKQFNIKYLGPSDFMGLHVTRDSIGLRVHQLNYA